jgi:hypothetical protein
MQAHDDFEVVIANDGSAPEPLLVIERLRSKTRLNLKRVWHLDHSRSYANHEGRRWNDAIRGETRSRRLTWTLHGIAQ